MRCCRELYLKNGVESGDDTQDTRQAILSSNIRIHRQGYEVECSLDYASSRDGHGSDSKGACTASDRLGKERTPI